MAEYKADAYLRISSAADGNVESDSIANQKKLIVDFVSSRPDIEIVSERVDDGYSGVLFDRPAFQEMMQDIKDGKINCVIVKDLSRLGREWIETGRYLQQVFPAFGVRFISINDGVDTADNRNGDDLSIALRNILNDAYSHDISVKTRSAFQIKRDLGEYVGSCPIYGYRKSPENKNKLIVDSDAARVIREIYRLRLEGTSANKIAEELNRRGVPSPLAHKINHGLPHPTGGFTDRPDPKWSAHAVLRILRDETYTGTLVQGRQETRNHKLRQLVQKPPEEWSRAENAHEAIISRHDFELVQNIAKLDTRTAPYGDNVYLFSGILICGCCGGQMIRKVTTVDGKKYVYYHCPAGKKRGCGRPVRLREDALEECVLKSLQAHVRNVLSVEELLKTIGMKKLGRDAAIKCGMRIAERESALEQARNCLASLDENFAKGILTKEEYRDHKEHFTLQLEQAREEIERLRQEMDAASGGARYFWTADFQKFDGLVKLDRRTVISLIESIRVLSKEDLEITYRYQSEYDKAQAELESAKEAL